MKVLSLIEPGATLIKEKKKLIETRSWKTNYRGELYIHGSSAPFFELWKDDERILNLIRDVPLNYSKIICKCNLVDCIYMTEEYIKNMKENNYQEYICGEYSVGRYAWILEDIEPLKTPIEAKGQLNIWNYYSENEVMDLMNGIEYGWLAKDNKIHNNDGETFSSNYILQNPKEVIMNKVGVCWDQVELERYYFKSNPWNIKTYFIVHYDNDKCPTHTFLTYEKQHKYYWFEHAWEKFRGIHEYVSLKELLLDVRDKFIKYELDNKYIKNNLVLHEYKKPKYHISTKEFYNHCDYGKYIDFESL